MDFKKNPITDFAPVNKLEKKQTQEVEEILGREFIPMIIYIMSKISRRYRIRPNWLFNRLQELEKSFPELRTEYSPTKSTRGSNRTDLIFSINFTQ